MTSVGCAAQVSNVLTTVILAEPEKLTIMSLSVQDKVQELSLSNAETFWDHHAKQLHWHKPYTTVLKESRKTLKNGVNHAFWEWFSGGELSTTYNCVDRHVKAGQGSEAAIIWDSPVTETKQRITYEALLDEVEVLAGVMKEEGVGKGDVVLIYSV